MIPSSLRPHIRSEPNDEDRIRLYDNAKKHGVYVIIEDELTWDERGILDRIYEKQQERMKRELQVSNNVVRMG